MIHTGLPNQLNQYDRRALPVAEAALAESKADLVILFGSRARGDYQENRSDIDLLLVQRQLPSPQGQQRTQTAASQAALNAYHKPLTVQITWQTTAEFEKRRRSINHMNARAVREGIIMPRNPENYPGEPADYSYEEKVVETRVNNAETHHQAFENYHFLFENGMTDADSLDRIAGKNAHEALEHALKGLIAANGNQYPKSHDLNELLQTAKAVDQEFGSEFQQSIDYNVLNQYAGSADYDIPAMLLTEIEHYREAVNNDYRQVRNRVSQLNPLSI